MATPTDSEFTSERFAALLESYGGDVGRWPQATRDDALALIARDVAAVRLLQETQALDRLLALAPVPAASARLVDRIVAQALAEGASTEGAGTIPREVSAAGGNVVALPIGRDRSEPTGVLSAGPNAWGVPRRRLAGAGGMLAASLLIGVWLGAFQGRQSAALEAMSEIVQSALPLDLLEASDEDTL